MAAVCVFCGSASGKGDDYLEFGKQVGHLIAEQNMELVYGGASIGLMGAVADGAMKANGKVIGVIPTFLKKLEVAHEGLSELIETDNMHERKQVMYDRSETFLALPGGLGTMDELCEIATWEQLGIHNKKIVVFNHDGFFDHFISHLKKCLETGFLSQEHFDFFHFVKNMDELKAEIS